MQKYGAARRIHQIELKSLSRFFLLLDVFLSESFSLSKATLSQLLKDKSSLDEELKAIEKQIYELEESYIGLTLTTI